MFQNCIAAEPVYNQQAFQHHSFGFKSRSLHSDTTNGYIFEWSVIFVRLRVFYGVYTVQTSDCSAKHAKALRVRIF